MKRFFIISVVLLAVIFLSSNGFGSGILKSVRDGIMTFVDSNGENYIENKRNDLIIEINKKKDKYDELGRIIDKKREIVDSNRSVVKLGQEFAEKGMKIFGGKYVEMAKIKEWIRKIRKSIIFE